MQTSQDRALVDVIEDMAADGDWPKSAVTAVRTLVDMVRKQRATADQLIAAAHGDWVCIRLYDERRVHRTEGYSMDDVLRVLDLRSAEVAELSGKVLEAETLLRTICDKSRHDHGLIAAAAEKMLREWRPVDHGLD